MKRISDKQAKAAKALARIKPPSDGLCELCRQKPDFRGLQKHHKKRRSDGRDDKRSNLVWICAKCHNGAKGHKAESYEKPKPVDKTPALAGYRKGLQSYPKSEQCGQKK